MAFLLKQAVARGHGGPNARAPEAEVFCFFFSKKKRFL
jgi:hypothetical protein